MTAPLIISHVYRRTTLAFSSRPTGGCAYAGCGQPADAHQRRVRDSGPGRAPAGGRGSGERDPGRATPGGAP